MTRHRRTTAQIIGGAAGVIVALAILAAITGSVYWIIAVVAVIAAASLMLRS